MHPSPLLRKQLLRSKQQVCLDRRDPIEPLRTVAHSITRRARMSIALAGQAALALFLSMPSVPASAGQPAWVCPMLLMDFECTQYRQRLERAADNVARYRIDHEYRLIIEDRRQACLCNTTQEQRETLVQAAADRTTSLPRRQPGTRRLAPQ